MRATADALVPNDSRSPFPRTRFQGSKRRHAEAILTQLKPLSFTTALDAFGGTGAIAHALKRAGKHVTYNDYMRFNHQIGLALIENDRVTFDPSVAARLGEHAPRRRYGDFIARTFGGIYFTDAENRWLDAAVTNIRAFRNRYRRALAWHCVFQAAMAKRPYNLFHRKNLYLREATVERSFGNKTSWDRSFGEHMRAIAEEANQAILDSGGNCRALCGDVLGDQLGESFDLVYLDPPYINRRGVGVDYHAFYHFLEGMVRYDEWKGLVDYGSKHRRLRAEPCCWTDARRIHDAFQSVFDRFRESIIVVSYRSDGVPKPDEITSMLRGHKRKVRVIELGRNQYVLSTRRTTHELLWITED